MAYTHYNQYHHAQPPSHSESCNALQYVLQCKLQLMSTMSASEVFVLVVIGKKDTSANCRGPDHLGH